MPPTLIMWFHLLAAIAWIGGMLFQWLVLNPVLDKFFPDPEGEKIRVRVGERFRTIRWIALLTLLGTGVFNLIHEGNSARLDSEWGVYLSVKLLLVAAAMGLSGVNDFMLYPAHGGSIPSKSRLKEGVEGIIFLLGLMIVWVAVYMSHS
jgi:putative copper resistance protein D